MKSKNKLSKGILIGLVAALAVTFSLSGCGSVIDGDFSPFSADSHHPFESTVDHGGYLKDNSYGFDECTACHGADLKGVDNGAFTADGEKDRSCYKCHKSQNHGIGMVKARIEHPQYMRDNNWDLSLCYTCHSNPAGATGIDFGGSCSNNACHSSSPAGPQVCNNCHGTSDIDPDNQAGWAPPASLSGAQSISDAAVGVHQAHLTGDNDRTTRILTCQDCHTVSESWDNPGHIEDSTPGQAEVVFHFPTTSRIAPGGYDRNSLTCSSTYCHGGKTSNWTTEGGWSDCTDCHEMPPAGGHYQWPTLEQCYWCHSLVIDESGAIIAPRLHVNGVVNEN